MTLLSSVTSDTALEWIGQYLTYRIGIKLCVSLSTDNRNFLVSDHEGLVFRVPRFDLEKFTQPDAVSVISCQLAECAYISKLYCFSDTNEQIVRGWTESSNEQLISFSCDIISFIYFNLTRLEELLPSHLDKHQRFQSSESIAYKFGYIAIPVVDHWIIVLRSLYKRVRKDYKCMIDHYALLLTHDVDMPFRYSFSGGYTFLRFVIARIVKRQFRDLVDFILFLIGGREDPADTFDFIMDHSERLSIHSHFNFIAGQTSRRWDGNYRLSQKKIVQLLKKIHLRQHEIGVHFSYNTFQSQGEMAREVDALRDALRRICVPPPDVISGRMHYLRWECWETAINLSNNGILCDTTLGFADRTGFRAGTCIPYRPFDPLRLSEVPITLIPLVAMEGSIWGENYMNIQSTDAIYEEFATIVDRVREVNGVCNLLWHNSDLTEKWQKDLYIRVVEYAK